jgi:hypothetical protein
VILPTVPEPYYTGPATDFRRLDYEVRKKAAEIFAGRSWKFRRFGKNEGIEIVTPA